MIALDAGGRGNVSGTTRDLNHKYVSTRLYIKGLHIQHKGYCKISNIPAIIGSHTIML